MQTFLARASYRARATHHLLTWMALVTTGITSGLIAIFTTTPVLLAGSRLTPRTPGGAHQQLQAFVAVPTLLGLLVLAATVALLGILSGGMRPATR